MLTTRGQLIDTLADIQNSASKINHDIMTFSSFLNDDELRTYLQQHFSDLPRLRKIEVLERARTRIGGR